MTLLPPGVKVHLGFGYTDMRKGIDGLAMLVQEAKCSNRNPYVSYRRLYQHHRPIASISPRTVRTSRLSCRRAGKARVFTPLRELSGKFRLKSPSACDRLRTIGGHVPWPICPNLRKS